MVKEKSNHLGSPKVMYYYYMIQTISYKDFTADIMGIELPEETRADDE